MNIIEIDYTWASELTPRTVTNFIIMHHEAGSGMTPQAIHEMHKGFGWAGIGYHFLVRKDGLVYRGRPIDSVGAHTFEFNSQSIGICAEGNYEAEIMGDTQQAAVADLLRYLQQLYPLAKPAKHKDFNATACPGVNYPFDEIVSQAAAAGPTMQAIGRLVQAGIIQTPEYWQVNAVPGGSCKGEFADILIRNLAAYKSGQAGLPLAQAVNVLQAVGVIISPEYWLANAIAGGACKGEYVAMLIINFAKTI
jgi:N-acetylmuramoyl-L-alanine amidase